MNRERRDFRICVFPIAFVLLWFVLICFADTVLAQSAGETQEPSSAPDTTVQERGNDSDHLSAARLPLSSVPWFLRSMGSSVGFSLGAYGTYDPNALVASSGGKPEALKSGWLTPSVFANIRKRRSQVFLNYSFQANYSRPSQFNGSSHTATLNFTRALSPKLSFGLGDTFTSSLYNQRTFLDPAVLGAYELNAAQDLDVLSQRVTRNSISATANYQMSRRNSLSVFSTYDYWRYTAVNLGNTQDVLVGVHSGFRINKWLYLDNSYSHYFNIGNNPLVGSGDGQIHHLGVGGLRLARSRRGWEAFLTGGTDISTSGGRPTLPIPSLQAGLSKNWHSGQFSVVYSRGFWIAVGPGTPLQGDTANFTFNQYLRRLSLGVGSIYRRGTAAGGSIADLLSPNARVGFAVQRYVMMQADYSYVSQRVANISPDVQNTSHYRVGVGINCFFTPLFKR
jgi:hypothetical protein